MEPSGHESAETSRFRASIVARAHFIEDLLAGRSEGLKTSSSEDLVVATT